MFLFCFILQSSFFAHFMCFEVPALAPPGGAGNDNKNRSNNDDGNDDDDLGIMDIDETDKKTGNLKLQLSVKLSLHTRIRSNSCENKTIFQFCR